MEIYSQISAEYENLKENLNILQTSKESENEVVSKILNNLKFLRNSCVKGSEIQKFIYSLPDFLNLILPLLKNQLQLENSTNNENGNNLCRMSWQLIANLCVQNVEMQNVIWQNLGQLIIEQLENEITIVTNIQLMIIYNIFYNGNLKINENQLFKLILQIWNKICTDKTEELMNLDFFHIIMEHFVVKFPRIVSLYGPLNTSERIIFLKYLSYYIKNDSLNGPIEKSLLNYLSKEFKMKSDCILKVVKNQNSINNDSTINPIEIFTLLEIISTASGNQFYENLFKTDHSLFLNVGGLLQQLIEIGKQKTKNIFTPLQKLEEVAPNSQLKSRDFEHEISYEFKTMLVRTLANLLYKNKINQEYARDAGIIMAICDCTTVDARNPLIKEWSILAIRNLCENCPENQEIIRNLCKVGDAPNEILKELNIEFGSLRIRPNV